jgi:hypothetical protein
MAKYSPQFDLYKIIERLKSVLVYLFWIIFLLSIIPTFFKEFLVKWSINEEIDVLNIISIFAYFLIEVLVDLILIPLAENKRMDDFIDNSFDSNFSTKNSVEYFNNEEIPKGFYKAATNLFQNCFFSFNLLKRLTVRKIILPAFVITAVWVAAYYGFKEVPFALSLLQVLFSANLLGALIKHLILLTRLSYIYDDWMKLFQSNDLTSVDNKYPNYIFRTWLRYETLISKIPLDIPNSFFQKKNTQLTSDWIALKTKLNIR